MYRVIVIDKMDRKELSRLTPAMVTAIAIGIFTIVSISTLLGSSANGTTAIGLVVGIVIAATILAIWSYKYINRYIQQLLEQAEQSKNTGQELDTSDDLVNLENTIAHISDLAVKQIDESCTQMDVAMTDMSARFAGLVEKLDSSMGAAEAAAGGDDNEENIFGRSRTKLGNITTVLSESAKVRDGMFAQVRELATQVTDLKSMAESVEKIASQTNLLALNAAIEAARAGEMGRGFAVVADEVRSLSHQSGKTGVEISELVGNISAAMDSTLAQVDELADEDKKVEIESKESIDEVLNNLEGMTNGLKDSSGILKQNSEGIKIEIYDVLQSLQFHDRITQILTHVRDSFDVFHQEVEACHLKRSNGEDSRIDESKIMGHLKSGYVTREQKIMHEGGDVSGPQDEEIEFF